MSSNLSTPEKGVGNISATSPASGTRPKPKPKQAKANYDKVRVNLISRFDDEGEDMFASLSRTLGVDPVPSPAQESGNASVPAEQAVVAQVTTGETQVAAKESSVASVPPAAATVPLPQSTLQPPTPTEKVPTVGGPSGDSSSASPKSSGGSWWMAFFTFFLECFRYCLQYVCETIHEHPVTSKCMLFVLRQTARPEIVACFQGLQWLSQFQWLLKIPVYPLIFICCLVAHPPFWKFVYRRGRIILVLFLVYLMGLYTPRGDGDIEGLESKHTEVVTKTFKLRNDSGKNEGAALTMCDFTLRGYQANFEAYHLMQMRTLSATTFCTPQKIPPKQCEQYFDELQAAFIGQPYDPGLRNLCANNQWRHDACKFTIPVLPAVLKQAHNYTDWLIQHQIQTKITAYKDSGLTDIAVLNKSNATIVTLKDVDSEDSRTVFNSSVLIQSVDSHLLNTHENDLEERKELLRMQQNADWSTKAVNGVSNVVQVVMPWVPVALRGLHFVLGIGFKTLDAAHTVGTTVSKIRIYETIKSISSVDVRVIDLSNVQLFNNERMHLTLTGSVSQGLIDSERAKTEQAFGTQDVATQNRPQMEQYVRSQGVINEITVVTEPKMDESRTQNQNSYEPLDVSRGPGGSYMAAKATYYINWTILLVFTGGFCYVLCTNETARNLVLELIERSVQKSVNAISPKDESHESFPLLTPSHIQKKKKSTFMRSMQAIWGKAKPVPASRAAQQSVFARNVQAAVPNPRAAQEHAIRQQVAAFWQQAESVVEDLHLYD